MRTSVGVSHTYEVPHVSLDEIASYLESEGIYVRVCVCGSAPVYGKMGSIPYRQWMSCETPVDHPMDALLHTS